jgi:hypothetical protein
MASSLSIKMAQNHWEMFAAALRPLSHVPSVRQKGKGSRQKLKIPLSLKTPKLRKIKGLESMEGRATKIPTTLQRPAEL